MSRRILWLLLLMTTMATAVAANITGTIVDSAGEPLPQATVRLLSASDSSFVKGVATNLDGKFTIASVKKGKYIIEATYIGYNNAYANIEMAGSNIALQPIKMSESSTLLKEVRVVGVKTPVKVMEDTVEYNADSYKTAPNAVVEDLLKRLPGVEVGSDGKITANGKSVSKILVDGKEFFSDDPTVASKNLPVDMVDKLQVVDRKSDLARLTGVDDGEDETVINLTVKKGMKNGWFGNVEGGYGTDDRYLATFNINRFWNDNQFTFLGNANNINQLGFSDGNSGRFRRFGGDNGITTSQALGFNFNVGNKEIFRVGGDVMWSRSDRDTRQQTERTYLFTDSTSLDRIVKATRDRGQNVRADFRIQWKPDSFNTLDVRPRISWNHNHSTSVDSTNSFAGDIAHTFVSHSLNTGDSRGNSWEMGLQAIYNHTFRSRPGRSFSIMANYSHSNTREYDDTYSYNIFYQLNDSTDIYDQYSDNHTWNNSIRGRVSWTEPIGDSKNGNFLTFAYGATARWNDADKLVYDLVDPTLRYNSTDYYNYLQYRMLQSNPIAAFALSETAQQVLNEDLSNRFRNDFFTQNIRFGYKKVSKTTNLEAGVSVNPSMSKSENLINDAKSIPTRWVWNYAPFLRYRYKMSKSRSLQMNYMGRSSQPSMSQLQPVPDMSNPLRIIIGNPELDPTFTHNINIRFQDFNSEKQRSVMLMGNFSVVQNSIVSSTTFDRETSAQTTRYANVNGVWNGRIMNMISLPFRNKAWQFSNHIFTNFNHNVGFNNGIRNNSTSIMASEMLSISFRPDNMEFSLRPRYSLQYTHNSVTTRSNDGAGNMVHTYGGMFDAYYYTPIGVIINTDLNFSATEGYSKGYDKNQWLWNASLSYQFLHDKSATFTLKVYDLLQQRSNISRNETSQYIDDVIYNSLTRYFMVTFSYRFSTFGKGKEPKAEGGDFMRGGHPGPPPGAGGGQRRGGMGGGRPF